MKDLQIDESNIAFLYEIDDILTDLTREQRKMLLAALEINDLPDEALDDLGGDLADLIWIESGCNIEIIRKLRKSIN